MPFPHAMPQALPLRAGNVWKYCMFDLPVVNLPALAPESSGKAPKFRDSARE
jgi:hypothetical protein